LLASSTSFNSLKNASVRSVSKVGAARYLVELAGLIENKQVKYQVIVVSKTDGSYDIVDGNFVEEAAPVYQECSLSSVDVRAADGLVRSNLINRMPEYVRLWKSYRDQPYYRLVYLASDRRYTVDLVHDLMMNKATVSSLTVTDSPSAPTTDSNGGNRIASVINTS